MRQFFTQNLKMLFAAHHFVYKSQDVHEIASVINTKAEIVEEWMQSIDWLEALGYWGNRPKADDLRDAERCWTDMIENSEDLYPIDYPDKPMHHSYTQNTFDVSALIKSHLFCVDGLCRDEIRARLAEERQFESNPVRYEGQALENAYYWWLYPNYDDGIYSAVLARVNIADDLVIGTGEETCLVCIRHGRLTITRKIADDVVNVSDERLLVCL